jgi:uncharacterized protein YdeI (YjbR/CyaY-like superfamily)
MPALPKDDLPILEFAHRDAWSDWLESTHNTSHGVWIKIAKKATGIPTVTHAEALEDALCYGWIDGQRAPHDETHFLQRFTPRRARSRWSQINRDKAITLVEQGRMKPAGLEQIQAAKADGRWEAAYAPQSSQAVPEDFQRALDDNPAANEFFKTLRGQRRYAFVYRVGAAKRPETRARRIEEYVAILAEGRTLT